MPFIDMAWFDRVEAKLNALTTQLQSIGAQVGVIAQTTQQEILNMARDFSNVTAQIATLTDKVNAAAGVDASVETLLSGIVAQQQALADQIAALTADSVTQQQLDDIAAQVGAQASALDAATTQLQAAVVSKP